MYVCTYMYMHMHIQVHSPVGICDRHNNCSFYCNCRSKELKQEFINCVFIVIEHIQLPASFGYVMCFLRIVTHSNQKGELV